MASQTSDPDLVEPKGPKYLPGVCFFSLWRNVLQFLSGLRLYGDISIVSLFGTPMYLISHPREIAELFRIEKQESSDITKNFFYTAFKPAFGDGVFNSFGKEWQSQRDILQPHFKKSAVKQWYPIVFDTTISRFKLMSGRLPCSCDLVAEMLPLVQGIMSECLFSRSLNDKDSQACVAAIQEVSKQVSRRAYLSFIGHGILNRLPTPGNRRFQAALNTIDKTLLNMRDQCLAEPKSDNFFSTLVHQLNVTELRDQLFTLFFAGQDTSVNAIAWTVYYLALHPEVEEKIRKEIDSTLGNDGNMSYEKMDGLVYTRCVVMESMRLSPPAYALYRNSVRETRLARYRIKRNAVLTLCPYVTQRDPDLWENPNQFVPERFMSPNRPETYAYYPFGGGQRVCLGQHLAMMEIVTITALFVASFRFELLPKPKVVADTFMTLRPKYGIPVKLEQTGLFGLVERFDGQRNAGSEV